jgi:hypothetical protein
MKWPLCQSSTAWPSTTRFREPPGLDLISENDIDPVDDMAIRSNHVGPVLSHFSGVSPGEVSHSLKRAAVSARRARRKRSSRAMLPEARALASPPQPLAQPLAAAGVIARKRLILKLGKCITSHERGNT